VDTAGRRGAARRLTTARCERWDAARRVAAARRERWGAAVSRRVARVIPRGYRVGGGEATPQPTANARRRQIHPRDPLLYPASRHTPRSELTGCNARVFSTK
jgi:hypothetical protein